MEFKKIIWLFADIIISWVQKSSSLKQTNQFFYVENFKSCPFKENILQFIINALLLIIIKPTSWF